MNTYYINHRSEYISVTYDLEFDLEIIFLYFNLLYLGKMSRAMSGGVFEENVQGNVWGKIGKNVQGNVRKMSGGNVWGKCPGECLGKDWKNVQGNV